MRRSILTLTAAAGLLAMAMSGRTSAQISGADPRAGPLAAGFTQLFISPCGEPFRGKPGDPYPVALWFKNADTNHDGVLTLEEFRADHAGFFYALDNDDAGYLDGGKIAFYERRLLADVYMTQQLGLNDARRGGAEVIRAQVLAPTPVEGSHPGEERGYREPGHSQGPAPDLGATRSRRQREMTGAAPYGLLGENEPVTGADTNLDGRITKAEFMAAADRRFKLLDKRHDGKLTLDELPLTPSQIELAKADKRR